MVSFFASVMFVTNISMIQPKNAVNERIIDGSVLPIAVESGVEDTNSLDKVNSYPIVGILIKPFKESDLRRIVEKSYATYF